MIDGRVAKRLRNMARRLGVSVATLLHAIWGLVVARTAGRDDVVYGTVLLGRLHGSAGARRVLGMFINTLPLRLRLQGLTTKELVEHTQRELVELLGYEQASLAEAQRCSGICQATPLFGALLNYRHSATPSGGRSIPDIDLLACEGRTNYPLALSVDDLGEEIAIAVQAEAPIDPYRVFGYVATAAESVVNALEKAPLTPALALRVLPEPEERRVVSSFNATATAFPRDNSIHELFEEQVIRSGKAIAVSFEGVSLTYEELNRRANQLAAYLRKIGMQADECVPILMPRSLSMLVAQIGVLKCGGAYVPLDPDTPSQRLMFILRDCGARRVVSKGALQPEWLPTSIEWIDCTDAYRVHASDANASVKVGALSPAYIMYTSGSTGTPKGVIVPHRAVIRLVINGGYADIRSTDCISHCSNPAFDASTFEIWGSLLNGARVLIVPQSVVLDPTQLSALLRAEHVTILFLTTGLLREYREALAATFAGIRYLITGGDIMDPETARRVLQREPPQHLLNAYGPTECATFATTHRVEAREVKDAAPISIGRPISNTSVYILDGRQQPVPLGVTGEIFIGGQGVALGYLNRPELTAQRFVSDPFSTDANGRMYRTGDLGRWRADGTIEYLGRNDEQVKIRGFRIELGEIEARLLRHEQVREAVVLAREEDPGQKRLVGYVVAKEAASAPSAETLREHLMGALPEYMVPSAFVLLPAFPLTPNGKLDRRALPAPDHSAYTQREYEAPRGEVEEILAGIWQELLKVQEVGRNDNFFELGGHSLLGMKLIALVRPRLSCSLPISAVFRYPCLFELAAAVSSMQQSGSGAPDSTSDGYEDGVIPLSAQSGERAPVGATENL